MHEWPCEVLYAMLLPSVDPPGSEYQLSAEVSLLSRRTHWQAEGLGHLNYYHGPGFTRILGSWVPCFGRDVDWHSQYLHRWSSWFFFGQDRDKNASI